jgi:hypothetical protein
MSPDSSCEAIEKSIWFGRSSFGERHHRTHNNSSLVSRQGHDRPLCRRCPLTHPVFPVALLRVVEPYDWESVLMLE